MLFIKHLEFGNRWSEIAEFLPGRTDNSIKNHFYSKLRKFLRKILRVISKESKEPFLKQYNINFNKYDADKVYQIIRREKVPYNTLTKESVINIIINYEKNKKSDVQEQKSDKIQPLFYNAKNKVKLRLSKNIFNLFLELKQLYNKNVIIKKKRKELYIVINKNVFYKKFDDEDNGLDYTNDYNNTFNNNLASMNNFNNMANMANNDNIKNMNNMNNINNMNNFDNLNNMNNMNNMNNISIMNILSNRSSLNTINNMSLDNDNLTFNANNNEAYEDQGSQENNDNDINKGVKQNIISMKQLMKMANEHSTSPHGFNQMGQGFFDFFQNSISDPNSPINFLNKNVFPTTEKHGVNGDKYPNFLKSPTFQNKYNNYNNYQNHNYPNYPNYHNNNFNNYLNMDPFFKTNSHTHMTSSTPSSNLFLQPANVNPLNSMSHENCDRTPQTTNPFMNDYFSNYQNYINSNNFNSGINNNNNFNVYEQQKLLDTANDKHKEDQGTNNSNVSKSKTLNLPELNMDIINYSDPEKIMSERITYDLYYLSNTPVESSTNKFWLNILTTNTNLKLKIPNSNIQSENGNGGEFQVIKPHTLSSHTLTPPKEHPKEIEDISPKSSNVQNASGSNILTLAVSPKSAFAMGLKK